MGITVRHLLDFDDPAEIAAWRAVDDVVMGGVSWSRFVAAAPGVAAFTGEVSLAQGGGFASVRTAPRRWNAAGAVAFLLRVRGDGRRYKLNLRTDDAFDGIAWQAGFATRAGEWLEVELPVAEFAPTFRGRRVPGIPPLDPARLAALGLVIAERQAGPFRLELDWIGVRVPE